MKLKIAALMLALTPLVPKVAAAQEFRFEVRVPLPPVGYDEGAPPVKPQFSSPGRWAWYAGSGWRWVPAPCPPEGRWYRHDHGRHRGWWKHYRRWRDEDDDN